MTRAFFGAALFQLALLGMLILPQLQLLSARDQLLLETMTIPGESADALGRIVVKYRISTLPRRLLHGNLPLPGQTVYVQFKRAVDGFSEARAFGTERPAGEITLAGTVRGLPAGGVDITYGAETAFLSAEQLADFEFVQIRKAAAGQRSAVRVKLRVDGTGRAAVEAVDIAPERDDTPLVQGAAVREASTPMKRVRVSGTPGEPVVEFYALHDSHEAVQLDQAHPSQCRRLASNVADLSEAPHRQRLLLRFPLPRLPPEAMERARLYLRYEENDRPGQNTLEVWTIRRAYGTGTVTDWEEGGRQIGAPTWLHAYYPEVPWTQPGLGPGDLEPEPAAFSLPEAAGLVAVDVTEIYRRDLARPGTWNGLLIRLKGPEGAAKVWWRGSPWDGSPGAVLEVRQREYPMTPK
jgi:hypothetical protein